ncbi:hypothetical protein ACQKM1_09395 [Peribacillus frigoritolerans]|uniref:hypothetical protein n=1 Tax=Peribacillus frigoritolerans TaxID=450367 RepID=UPI003D0558B9
MTGSMNLLSPVTFWKNGNRIVIKIETIDVVLSVSPTKQPKQFERLERLLNGRDLPPFITYSKEED